MLLAMVEDLLFFSPAFFFFLSRQWLRISHKSASSKTWRFEKE